MVSLLLIISFLLHLLSLYAIYQLFQYIKKQERGADEITDLFESYLQEFRQENAILKEQVQNSNKEGQRVSLYETVRPDEEESPKEEAVEEKRNDDAAPKFPEIDVQDQVEASLESRVLQLESQGVPPDNIAKQLNCGKTEVELILNLYKKKKD
jgi:DNA polymerase I-like protein with 3'-5' exonuclease and polymerase domains